MVLPIGNILWGNATQGGITPAWYYKSRQSFSFASDLPNIQPGSNGIFISWLLEDNHRLRKSKKISRRISIPFRRPSVFSLKNYRSSRRSEFPLAKIKNDCHSQEHANKISANWKFKCRHLEKSKLPSFAKTRLSPPTSPNPTWYIPRRIVRERFGGKALSIRQPTAVYPALYLWDKKHQKSWNSRFSCVWTGKRCLPTCKPITINIPSPRMVLKPSGT